MRIRLTDDFFEFLGRDGFGGEVSDGGGLPAGPWPGGIEQGEGDAGGGGYLLGGGAGSARVRGRRRWFGGEGVAGGGLMWRRRGRDGAASARRGSAGGSGLLYLFSSASVLLLITKPVELPNLLLQCASVSAGRGFSRTGTTSVVNLRRGSPCAAMFPSP